MRRKTKCQRVDKSFREKKIKKKKTKQKFWKREVDLVVLGGKRVSIY